ncbi:nucleoprotein [Lepeophtheirus salmonis rhabdovirus 9]|uniref:Nucleoprotein n=1 Tax=Lepeophtheirus salmonis rhabdovirus 9 TaxID=1573760 RepID=A0A0A1E6C9_9RHAB|nr:nucleoprotein [Lepeophtheirus salmonis rhabdovirus 9]AIY25907.1 nucleoprotein [Lepeophtheirus salmonis rhabdovirus 9]
MAAKHPESININKGPGASPALFSRTDMETEFHVNLSKPGIQSQYPSEWFSAGNKRPSVSVKVPTTYLKKESRDYFCNLLNNSLTVPEWSTIQGMVWLSEMYPSQLKGNDVLESFGIKLTDDKNQVTVKSILNYAEVEDPTTTLKPPANNKTEWTDQEYFVGITAVLVSYRYHRLVHEEGREALLRRLAGMLTSQTLSLASIVRKALPEPGEDMRKVMAALDLQFNLGDGNPEFKRVRMGTVHLLQRDQTFLSEVLAISGWFGTESYEMIKWIFSAEVAKEVRDRFSHADEEAGQQFSYSAYMIDFGISNRSPYSVTANPLFHMWVHIIGVLLGKVRSYNAIQLEDGLIGRYFLASALTAFRWSQSSTLDTQIFEKIVRDDIQEEYNNKRKNRDLLEHQLGPGGEEDFADDFSEDSDDDEDTIRKKIRTPREAVAWCGGVWKRPLFEWVDGTLSSKVHNMRQGSMGRAVREYWKSNRSSINRDRWILTPWDEGHSSSY